MYGWTPPFPSGPPISRSRSAFFLRHLTTCLAALVVVLSSFYVGKYSEQQANLKISQLTSHNWHSANVGVVAVMTREDEFDWVKEEFSKWEYHPYVDVGGNGGEAIHYLTYIIDHYDTLPGVTIFFHGQQEHETQVSSITDIKAAMKLFRPQNLQATGFVNLRCLPYSSCSISIQTPRRHALQTMNLDFTEVYREMFHKGSGRKTSGNSDVVPELVGSACGSEFAVTKSRLRSREKKEYERYRKWLVKKSKGDRGNANQIFELLWPAIFGTPAVNSPNVTECYCKTYGLCKLQCNEDNGKCEIPF